MKVKTNFSAIILLLMPQFLIGAGLHLRTDNPKVNLSVLRRVNIEYRLLTRDNPIEFEVTPVDSPASGRWLRIYTRLLWPAGATGTRRYRLSLWEGEVERPVEFETRLSATSYGPSGHKVGAWRSFFVELPRGTTRYRLVTDGPETIAVRIAFQAPRPWQATKITGQQELILVEGGSEQRYYEFFPKAPVKTKVSGPCRVRVRCRLNYTPELTGNQNFILTVSEGEKVLVKKNLRVGRSETARFRNRPELVPSTERRLRFELSGGEHELTIILSGTIAKSGAVALEVLPNEKFE
ncbi:MAG: hypothetical protein ABIK44_00310 [candidate division WOR-3 bacterium]